jgi:hypothetical protein
MKHLHSLFPLSSRTALTARVTLTSAFWGHALLVLAGPYSSLGELPLQGADALRFYLLMTICLQFFGSALVIADRGMWVGMSALAADLVVAVSVVRSGSGLYAAGTLPQIQVVLVQIVALTGIVGLALIESRQTSSQQHSSTADEAEHRNGCKPGNWRYI